MANFDNDPTWIDDIYELATTDRAKGGPEGVLNVAPKQLADRTAYLKQRVDELSFNVKDYGAVGDGSADDTAEIQAAVDAAAASGGTAYFPAGVYRISVATSILLRSGVSLVGAGRDQTILLPTSTAAGSVIKRVAPASGGDHVEDIVIQGIGIVLNHTAPADPGNSEQIGFDFRHVTRSVIQDCYVGNYNKGNAGSFHTDPTNQANAAQGYGIVFGTYSSGNPLYSGGEVNRVVRTAVVGTKKAIVLDDLTLSPSSAAHATVIDSCDIQVAESGIAQESQYGTGNSFVNNTIQSIRNATGSSNTTYAVRVEGYSSVVTGGYTEVTSDCDYGLRLGSASASNYVRPHRVSSAATDISDIGTNNDVVVLDGTDAVHYGRQRLARGLIVEGSGASLGTWTTSGWPKTVQIGANSSDSTLRFPLNNGVQFGFAADAAGGRLFMLRSTAADNSAVASFPMVWETDGRLGLSLPGAVYPTAKLTIGAGTATAGSAPLKFIAGTNLTVAEAGTFEFDGTNFYATPGSVRKRLLPDHFNVKDFGAVGDGSADDTAAIQAAIAAAIAAGGGEVFFPVGTYLTAATITLGGNNIALRGVAGQSTIKAKNSTNFEHVIYATGRSNLHISNLVIDVNQAGRVASLTTRSNGVALAACTDCAIENVIAKNAIGSGGGTNVPGIGLSIAAGSVRGKVIDCTLLDCGIATKEADGVFLSGTQMLIADCTAKSCLDTAFVIETSQQSGISGCTALSCGVGAAITNASAADAHDNFINGLTVYDWSATLTGGIQIGNPDSATTGDLINTVVSAVALRNATGTGPGINVRKTGAAKTLGLVLSNIIVDGAGTQGILLNVEGATINACEITSTGSCIQVEAGSENVVVTNNRLYAGGAFGIVLGTGCDVVSVQGNHIESLGSMSWGIYAFGTSTNIRTDKNTIIGESLGEVGADITTTPYHLDQIIYAAAAPAAGLWPTGFKVFNNAPAAAGYTGWICTAGGTPGTWKGFGLIEA